MLRHDKAAFQFVTAILEDFNIDKKARLEFVKYRENHVFKAITEEQAFAMRIHRRHYRSDEELQSEAEFIDCLSKAGMHVPKQRKTIKGHHFLVKSDEEGGRLSNRRNRMDR